MISRARVYVESGWVDGYFFGVGSDGWLCWSPQKLILHLDLLIPVKITLITREFRRGEAECRQVPSSEIRCLMLIPFCIIDLNQRAAISDNIDVAQVVKA